jgi:hypothetical protein
MTPTRGLRRATPLAVGTASILALTAAVWLQAQTAAAAIHLGYDKAHEVTVNGSVQGMTRERRGDSPFGLHLFLAGSQGVVDVHLGPYLSKETQQALRIGTPVEVVGAIETTRDGRCLLARELIFGGREITLRNENGLLVRGQDARAKRSAAIGSTDKKSPGELN